MRVLRFRPCLWGMTSPLLTPPPLLLTPSPMLSSMPPLFMSSEVDGAKAPASCAYAGASPGGHLSSDDILEPGVLGEADTRVAGGGRRARARTYGARRERVEADNVR